MFVGKFMPARGVPEFAPKQADRRVSQRERWWCEHDAAQPEEIGFRFLRRTLSRRAGQLLTDQDVKRASRGRKRLEVS
jgi:hypothetical protein